MYYLTLLDVVLDILLDIIHMCNEMKQGSATMQFNNQWNNFINSHLEIL